MPRGYLLLRLHYFIFAMGLFFFLTACGGGSSDNSAPLPVTPDPVVEPDPEPTKGAPRGIFNSAGQLGPLTGNTMVRESINALAHVSGTLLRYSWSDINPNEGEFDFSQLSAELAEAQRLGTFTSMAIVDSKEMPTWLLEKCEAFDYEFRSEAVSTCLPWDATYLQYKESLIQALGEAFDNHEYLAGVYVTYAAMTNGIEMHWRVDEQEFIDAGYSFDRLSNAYNAVLDMYFAAFTETPIILEVHTVFNSEALAQSSYDYCFDQIGERCGVAIWWCASRMTNDPRDLEYAVYSVAQQAAQQSFAVCQTIASFTDSPDRYDQGMGWTSEEAFRNELSFFIAEGFKNFELWTNDIQNDSLTEILNNEFLSDLE